MATVTRSMFHVVKWQGLMLMTLGPKRSGWNRTPEGSFGGELPEPLLAVPGVGNEDSRMGGHAGNRYDGFGYSRLQKGAGQECILLL
jgi:hypothetical protein